MHKHNHRTTCFILIFILCGLSLCTGCGETPELAPATDGTVSSENESTPQPAPDTSENEISTQPAPDTSEKEISLPEPVDGQTADEPLLGTPLTKEELQVYTELIQQPSNYGFLLSDWDKPTDINLYEVFYNGAGISRDGTEAEIQAYLERNGQDELYTDFFVMDKTAVSNLLLEKTGLTYDEFVMKGGRGMEEIYYAESDSFCLEAGDTNFCMFECTEGVKNEEGTIVTLRYKGDYSWIEEGEVQMWEDGSSFRSNHILKGDFLDTLQSDATAE